MRGKLLIITIGILLIVFLPILVNAQTDTSIWRNDLNYSGVSDFEVAGWTTTHASGISFTSNGIILDGTDDDTAIHYRDITNGTSNWAVETKSRWLGAGHSGSSVCIVTEDHIYGFMPDGYYDNFAFYYDCSKVKTFDGYQESVNTWMTLKLEKYGNTIEMFYNDQLIGTYNVEDTSKVVGTDYVSPWEGNAEYDYIRIWSISGFGSSSGAEGSSQGSVFSNPLVIGGLVGGVGIGVGVAVYYFVIAGGSGAAASAGASSGATGSAGASAGSGGGSSGGGGSLIHPSSSSTLQTSGASTLNEVAMGYHVPPTMHEYGQTESDNLNMQHEAQTIQAEQNAASNNLQQTTQSVQDQINTTDQHIQNNTTNNQNMLHQQTNQLLQGSNKPPAENKPNVEVADSGSGSSGGES